MQPKVSRDLPKPAAGPGRSVVQRNAESLDEYLEEQAVKRASSFFGFGGPILALTDALGLTGPSLAVGGAKPAMTLRGERLSRLASTASGLRIEIVNERDEEIETTLREWLEYARSKGLSEHVHQIEKMAARASREWEMTVARGPGGEILGFSRSSYSGTGTVWKHGTVSSPKRKGTGAGKALMAYSARSALEDAGGDPSAAVVRLNAGNYTAQQIWFGMGFRME